MNRLGKEIFHAPRYSEKIDKLRKYVDSRGIDRTSETTGVEEKGHWSSRLKLYVAIYNYCNS